MPERLERVVAGALRIDESEVNDDLEFNRLHAWDSLNHVGLMLALEAEYGLVIPDEQLVELTSIRAIRRYIEDQTGIARSPTVA